jgi:FdhD protein
MKEKTERLAILRVTKQTVSETEDIIVTEFPLTIILNNQEVVTLLCSPTKLKYLAIGYLWSEGLINSKSEIEEIKLDRQSGVVRVKTKKVKPIYRETYLNSLSGGHDEAILTGCRVKCVISHHIGKCIMPQKEAYAATNLPFKPLIASSGRRGSVFFSSEKVKKSQIKISTSQVFHLMEEFIERSELFKATGGVHGAALCDADNLLIFSEDIGRHNAVDKIFGECILKDISMDNRIIITSGRVSSEILLKVAKASIPLLISKSATTNLAVKLANELGVTLIGFVRGERMNVYTHRWRIRTDGK